MAVRARRLFGPTNIVVASTWVPMFTVPAGRTLIVKALSVTSFSVGAQHYWGREISAGVWGLLYGSGITGGTSIAMGFGWCFDPGDVLGFWCATANVLTVYGAGSLLAGAPS